MLGLAVIVKDEIEEVKRIVIDYMGYFDELAFAIDDEETFNTLNDENESKKIKFFHYKWDAKEIKRGYPDFAKKRNFIRNKMECDYYMRIDTDDAIIGVENIRRTYDIAKSQDLSIVYCNYLYSKDENGVVNASHSRETIIKNCDNLQWNKRIHENILPKSMVGFKMENNKTIVIDHIQTEDHAAESHLRNAKALVEEYNEDRENPDPRTIAYLGRVFSSVKDYKRAIYFLEKHVKTSGWDEDRYISWCYLSECYRLQEKQDEALSCCLEALTERPDYPDAYAKLHDIYVEKCEWGKAIEWGTQALGKKQPETFMIKDPSVIGWRLYISMAFCLLQANKVEEAMEFFKAAKEQAPDLKFIKDNEKLYADAVLDKRYLEHFLWIFNYLRETDKDKLDSFIKSVPKDMIENPALVQIRNMFLPPVKYEDNSIAIFCSNTPDEWADPSILKGIGGSEEAVIYASRELTKLGYKVYVYNKCGEMAGEYKGVTYRNLYEFNPNDTYNIVISWRSNIFQHTPIKANKKIVWLHDLPQAEMFSDPDTFDKVIVLSEYHKSLLPNNIPEDKIAMSTNGINAKDFDKLAKIEREPFRMIYASSYDRGLEAILDMWPQIKAEVPNATLHCYYGWDTFKKFEKQGFRDSSFRLSMIEKMKQDGITEHGRIGHKQLLKEYAKSSVFAYPCSFKGEIQCIALTKAIACNNNIVTNKFAVMDERSPNSVDDEDLEQEIIAALNVPTKDGINPEYIEGMSWTKVVEGWDNEIFRV